MQAEGLSATSVSTVFFASLLVVSMICSPFLLSVSMWGFVAVALWHTASGQHAADRRRVAGWLMILAVSFRRFFRNTPLVLMALLFAVPAMSFFWSSDQHYWLERTRVRLPFFVMAWAFANLPALTRRQYSLVLYILVWALTLIALGVTINFALHFDTILKGLGEGRSIPVPRSHIRFSLITATGILAGAWLWVEGFYWKWRRERPVLAGAVIFLFLFIHILSVRSGIAGVYALVFFTIAWYGLQTRRWKTGLIAFVLAVFLPVAAINLIPSFRLKVDYTLWDWQQYRQNAGNHYSDSERWVSLLAGWQIWRENPLLGAGAGDVPAEVQRVVKQHYPDYMDAPKLPHNQFVYILAGTGLLGLTLSLVAFLTPLIMGQYRRFYLFSAFQMLVFMSFLVEYTIETAIGVSFYLFYTLWFMKMSAQKS
ncbi:MAG: O-antigen ligase family protein [Lewinellaceae bacterium]|nr:O-antigen ligase family protein [Lewinellaceae bacterium]